MTAEICFLPSPQFFSSSLEDFQLHHSRQGKLRHRSEQPQAGGCCNCGFSCSYLQIHLSPYQTWPGQSILQCVPHFGIFWCVSLVRTFTIVQRRVPKSTHMGWSRVLKLHLGRFGLEIRKSFVQPWDNLFKDRVGSPRWTPCEMTWGKMILLWGWGGGDDKSAGKRRCCCVLAQPQPCFRSGSPQQPAFGQGRGSAGVKYLQPSDTLIYCFP